MLLLSGILKQCFCATTVSLVQLVLSSKNTLASTIFFLRASLFQQQLNDIDGTYIFFTKKN